MSESYHALQDQIIDLKNQVAYWKRAYDQAIKHDDRVIRDLKEAQPVSPYACKTCGEPIVLQAPGIHWTSEKEAQDEKT